MEKLLPSEKKEYVLAVCRKGTSAKTAESDSRDVCDLKRPKILHIHQGKNDTDTANREEGHS